MSNPLEHFGLDRSPFADESPAAGIIGTRALRRLVARIQAALRDGHPRIGVHGPAGIGKSCLAAALPKLFAGHARVATVSDPGVDWPAIRASLARSWQLEGERLSRTTLLAAAARSRLVLALDRAEQAPESLLGHLDVLQGIADERGAPIVTSLLFVQTPVEPASGPSCAAVGWLERQHAVRLVFEALTPDAVADYIQRKLRRAGHLATPIFTPRAALVIHAETAGIPGEVSRLCGALLEAAAARRLRSIDEPFVRSRGEPTALRRPSLADETGIAWDDADHHPRETPGDALDLESAALPNPAPAATAAANASRQSGTRPDHGRASVRSPIRDEADGGDPELEAYLSAPPTQAELRAIRGGFLRRVARPFLLASLAVAIGGVLLALWTRSDRAQTTASTDGASGSRSLRVDAVEARARTGSDDTAHVAELDGVVLGRLRGPVDPAARARPGEDVLVPIPTRAASDTRAARRADDRLDALARSDATLRRARDFSEAGPRSSGAEDDARHAVVPDANLPELPDLRPPGLIPPAGVASPDL